MQLCESVDRVIECCVYKGQLKHENMGVSGPDAIRQSVYLTRLLTWIHEPRTAFPKVTDPHRFSFICVQLLYYTLTYVLSINSVIGL